MTPSSSLRCTQLCRGLIQLLSGSPRPVGGDGHAAADHPGAEGCSPGYAPHSHLPSPLPSWASGTILGATLGSQPPAVPILPAPKRLPGRSDGSREFMASPQGRLALPGVLPQAPPQLGPSQLPSPAWSPPHTACAAWGSHLEVHVRGRSAPSPALPPAIPTAGRVAVCSRLLSVPFPFLPSRIAPPPGPLHRNRLFAPRVHGSPPGLSGPQLRPPNPAAEGGPSSHVETSAALQCGDAPSLEPALPPDPQPTPHGPPRLPASRGSLPVLPPGHGSDHTSVTPQTLP